MIDSIDIPLMYGMHRVIVPRASNMLAVAEWERCLRVWYWSSEILEPEELLFHVVATRQDVYPVTEGKNLYPLDTVVVDEKEYHILIEQ